MTRMIDISVGLENGMVAWPGSIGYHHEWLGRIGPDSASNNSKIVTDVHIGTHVDAPLHFVEGGGTVEAMPLDVLVGPAWVADLLDVEGAITAAALAGAGIPDGTERLLLRTRNSALWRGGHEAFHEDFVALASDAAQWVVDQGIRLVGVDYLSVQRFHDGPETHRILLGAEVVAVEGLNLYAVAPGSYELIVLPLKLVGAEGAPARAILREHTTA